MLRRRSFLHLGTEVARTGGVPTDRAASAVRAVRRLQAAAEEAGVDVVVALATAALRDADNGAILLARLERILGTSITLLAGEEEARLCFLGQRAGVWVGREPVLGLDLGGGSLEAGTGTIDEIFSVASMPLGTARLRGELGTGELLTPEDRVAIARLVRQRSEPIRTMLAGVPGARNRVITSGGTVRALARLAMVLHRPETASGILPSGQPGGDPGRSALRAHRSSVHARPRRPAWPCPASTPGGRPSYPSGRWRCRRWWKTSGWTGSW